MSGIDEGRQDKRGEACFLLYTGILVIIQILAKVDLNRATSTGNVHRADWIF
jgi:hypothetical protein